MNSFVISRCLVAAVLGLGFLAAGCAEESQDAKTPAPSNPGEKKDGDGKIELGKNVWLEKDGDKRRVYIKTTVCRRTDQLEQLLCRKQTKEHESILTGDFDARLVHTALLLAGAEAGSPVKFADKIIPPRGTTIKVLLQYQKDGKTVSHPAQEWIRHITTKKPIAYEWVFAGSMLIADPLDPKKEPFYAANDGDVICVANFETAMLDLPIASSRDGADLAFEANTARIPALETPVLVILEPVLKEKKK